MNSSSQQEAFELLRAIQGKGVRVWAEGGRLRYRALKGSLSDRDLESMVESKQQLLSVLRSQSSPELPAGACAAGYATSSWAPLAYSQFSHWKRYDLGRRRSLCIIASATRMRGRVNIDTLQKAISVVVRRHDVLRTRIRVVDGIPWQEIVTGVDTVLTVDHLDSNGESLTDEAVGRYIQSRIVRGVNVMADPLFTAGLIYCDGDDSMLVLMMEHIIADAQSEAIVLSEILSAYSQLCAGTPLLLPEILIQFPDYCVWQRGEAEASAQRWNAYWSKRIASGAHLAFAAHPAGGLEGRSGWGIARLRIDADFKSELLRWCKENQTTLVMAVFSAYVAVVLRWCDASAGVVQYQVDGRTTREVKNTVGYFATMLYLMLDLMDDDTLLDLIRRVIPEYCAAYENLDYSFLETLTPPPVFTRNPAFNWVPRASMDSYGGLEVTTDAIGISALAFDHPMLMSLDRETEPFVVFYDSGDEVIGGVHFPQNRFVAASMAQFGSDILLVLQNAIARRTGRLYDVEMSDRGRARSATQAFSRFARAGS